MLRGLVAVIKRGIFNKPVALLKNYLGTYFVDSKGFSVRFLHLNQVCLVSEDVIITSQGRNTPNTASCVESQHPIQFP